MILKNMRNNKLTGFGLWGKDEYTGWQDEQMSWKDSCYIGDWSWLAEVRVKGPDAEKFFSGLCVNTFSNYEAGKCKHVIFCNNDGKIVGEGILIKRTPDTLEWQGGMQAPVDGPPVAWLKYHFQKEKYDAEMTFPNKLFKFQVSGPKSLKLLEKVCSTNLKDIPFMHIRNAIIDGTDVQLMRQGMAGEIGFEVQGNKEHSSRIHDFILQNGQEFGIKVLGSRTAMINHLEAAFPTIGCDYLPAVYSEGEQDFLKFANPQLDSTDIIDSDKISFSFLAKVGGSFDAGDISAWYRSPFELNWGKRVKFDHDFIGRKSLEAEAGNPKRVLVTLEWNSEDVLDVYASYYRDEVPYDFMDVPQRTGFCYSLDNVLVGGKCAGVSSSRGYSYYFRKTLSHCVIDIEYSKPGVEVLVEWGEPDHRKKMIRAVVAPTPYKRDNRRLDLKSL
jgi:vanillate/3-O-methylgallate O-demethylase